MLGKTEEKIDVPLFLSHWDAEVSHFIPANVLEDLKNYHLMGIRFLYDCFRKSQKGAILNHENDMNFQIQVSTFFNALATHITPKSPVLIASSEDSMNTWIYHLNVYGGFDVTVLSSKNCEEILLRNLHKVILTTVDNTQLLKEIKGIEFFAVVVEELDLNATKVAVKQLRGRFKIGLTTRNFFKDPEQKLFWTMLNWSNAGVAGKFDDFAIEDNSHFASFRDPYRKWWQRLTWRFCDTFKKPTSQEQKQYQLQLKDWLRQHRIAHSETASKRVTRMSKTKIPSNPIKHEFKTENQEIQESLHEDAKDIAQRSKRKKPNLVKIEPKSENEESGNVIENRCSKEAIDLRRSKREIHSEAIKTETEETNSEIKEEKQDAKNVSNDLIKNENSNIPNILDYFFKSNPTEDDSNSDNLQNLNSSEETIIDECQNLPSSDDENSILTSIISSNSDSMKFAKIKNDCGMDDDEDDILTSIIKN